MIALMLIGVMLAIWWLMKLFSYDARCNAATAKQHKEYAEVIASYERQIADKRAWLKTLTD